MFAVNSFLPRVPYLSQYSYSILGQIQNDAYNMELYPLTLPMQSTINEAIQTYVPSYACIFKFICYGMFLLASHRY